MIMKFLFLYSFFFLVLDMMIALCLKNQVMEFERKERERDGAEGGRER